MVNYISRFMCKSYFSLSLHMKDITHWRNDQTFDIMSKVSKSIDPGRLIENLFFRSAIWKTRQILINCDHCHTPLIFME